MAETRTPNRQQHAPADMRESGMPQGQAPAAQQQRSTPAQTAVQKAQHEANAFRLRLIEAAEAQQPLIESFLRSLGVDWDFFLSALKVGLANSMKNDRDFFDPYKGVTVTSFIDAVVRCAKDGLLPDGKQAAIARFDRTATYMPMVEGFCHILYATGLVKDINHNVVREGDDIDYMEGDDGYVRQRRPFKRVQGAVTIGAWCVINLNTGGKIVEICDDQDLAQIAKVSRAKKGPREDWKDEMHRKGPFRRAMKRAPKNKRLDQLLAHDDMNYDLSLANKSLDEDGKPAALTTEQMLSGRVQRPARKPRQAPALQAPEEPMDMMGQGEEEGAADQAEQAEEPNHLINAVGAVQNCDSATGLAELEIQFAKDPDLADLDDADRAWLNDEVAKKKATFLAAAGAPFELQAIIHTAEGAKVYDNATVWADALLVRMASIKKADQLASFWEKNRDFILDAGENGFDKDAERVLTVAEGRGLAVA